jgi:transcriptional regulator with XRE-family HTH domain
MLGAEIRKARLAAGISQDDLAYAARVDRTYVSLLERDRRSPSVKVFVDLCTALGISPSQLLARVERSIASTPRNRKGRRKQLS